MITPFLTLVLAGYAAFMLTLGSVWLNGCLQDAKLAKATSR